MASLVVQRTGHTDRDLELGDAVLTIGRQADCGLVIEDPSVSRRHAAIEWAGEGHTIRDLGSRNGTWLRGERIGEAPVQLAHGDEITLGRRGIVLRYLTEDATVPEWVSPLQNLSTYVPGFSTAWSGSGRALRLLRMTPWLRFVSAAVGLVGAILALIWWIAKWS